MNRFNLSRSIAVASVSLIAAAFLSTIALAQSVKVEGLIKARTGDIIVLKTSDAADVAVLLTDDTQVGQVQGLLQARRKEMSMAALIPGLAVKVEGTYNDQSQLVAKSVSFKGNDLKDAQKIDAGMHETREQAQKNQAELEKHNAELQKQNVALQQHQEQITANKAAIEANTARFGQLDDYYIYDEVTVYFGNGKVDVDPSYRPQLLALAEKAKTVNGYVVEVKGYASAVGSVALNQKLSEDRANEVVNILIQQGHIPLTRMLAPGAMGESEQVGTDTKAETADTQKENRRVVVRVLQNKAIAGI